MLLEFHQSLSRHVEWLVSEGHITREALEPYAKLGVTATKVHRGRVEHKNAIKILFMCLDSIHPPHDGVIRITRGNGAEGGIRVKS